MIVAGPASVDWSTKMHNNVAAEIGCFEKAFVETEHPSLRKFIVMDYMAMQQYIAQFKGFRKTDSQHSRTWRVYRAKLLTLQIKGQYDPDSDSVPF